MTELAEVAQKLRKEQEAEMDLAQQLHDQYDRKAGAYARPHLSST